jgi:hypothetical protein
MLTRSGHLSASSIKHVPIAAAAVAMLLFATPAAWPQAASPPTSLGVQAPAPQASPDRSAPLQSEPAPSSVQRREDNPGLLTEMGKLFEKSLSILPTLKTPGETIDDLNGRAKDSVKDATDVLSRLAKPSTMVAGRMICPVSANGAADCKAGADKLCQTKGFKEGRSLNTDSAETCSAKVLIPGRTRKPDDCRTSNYVTNALCQ